MGTGAGFGFTGAGGAGAWLVEGGADSLGTLSLGLAVIVAVAVLVTGAGGGVSFFFRSPTAKEEAIPAPRARPSTTTHAANVGDSTRYLKVPQGLRISGLLEEVIAIYVASVRGSLYFWFSLYDFSLGTSLSFRLRFCLGLGLRGRGLLGSIIF